MPDLDTLRALKERMDGLDGMAAGSPVPSVVTAGVVAQLLAALIAEAEADTPLAHMRGPMGG